MCHGTFSGDFKYRTISSPTCRMLEPRYAPHIFTIIINNNNTLHTTTAKLYTVTVTNVHSCLSYIRPFDHSKFIQSTCMIISFSNRHNVNAYVIDNTCISLYTHTNILPNSTHQLIHKQPYENIGWHRLKCEY